MLIICLDHVNILLFLSRQISLKFFPLGSYPAKQFLPVRTMLVVPTNISMNMLMAKMLEADAVSEGFAAGLKGEGRVHVAKREPLTIHSADRQTPEIIAVLKTPVSVTLYLLCIALPWQAVGYRMPPSPLCCFCTLK